VEIPFSAGSDPEVIGAGETIGHFRLHGVDNWFISYTQEEWDEMRSNEPEMIYAAALEMVDKVCSEKLPPEVYKKWRIEMFDNE
jgi:hypothetical protein